MQEKIKISLPILVEGKYDKNTIKQIFDATVITLGGFSVFNSKETQSLVKKLSDKGIIVLTDSDGGGKQIRSFINGLLPKEKIYNVYIPKIKGKERRKPHPSKEGLLGVEGMGREELIGALSPFIQDGGRAENIGAKSLKMLTKVDFYNDKLTGCDGAAERRACLCRMFDLPDDMTANSLLEALNLITDRDGYCLAVRTLNKDLDK